MFEEGKVHNSVYQLSVFLRPNGKCDINYLSGFADFMCALLKVRWGAMSRKFEKTPNNVLVCHLPINSDTGPEDELAQLIVDIIEASSMQLADFEMTIDGRKITLIEEK